MRFKKNMAMLLMVFGLTVAPNLITGCQDDDLGDQVEDAGDELD